MTLSLIEKKIRYTTNVKKIPRFFQIFTPHSIMNDQKEI